MFPINFTYKSATDELIVLILTYNYGFYCSSSVLFSFLFHTSEIGMSSPVVGLIYGRRQRQSTPVLLPGKSHGWRSLVGCSPWSCDWVTSLSLFTFMHWRRKWQPTPVLLPGESHGWRSLVGFSPWDWWVGHDWVTSLSLFTFMHWRRQWQPTPVFLPGESQGQGSLVGCCLWGCTESDMTEVT